MQTNSVLQGLAEGNLRKVAWSLSMSFDKTYAAGTTFFKVGDGGSEIGGTDLIPGTNSVVQEWDKYAYIDYSDRVISIDLTREVEQVFSVVSCQGDIVLSNHDDYFTPGAGSPIDQYLLPYRPLRIYEGFGDQLISVFIGVADGTPVIDERAKTASFHIIDFFNTLWDKNLDTLPLATNVRTDEAIEDVLVNAGLLSSQLVLDRGFNTLDYFAVDKGTKVIDVLQQLMEAEQGRLYMDEQGVIRFKNRQNYDTANVMRFDETRNIAKASRTREDSIVNVVEINADIRTLSSNAKVFESTTSTLIPAGSTADVWAVLAAPVSSIDAPVYVDSAATSLFTCNTAEDGTGTANSTNVTCTTNTTYGKSYFMTFTNSSTTQNLYVTSIQLYGTPYIITDEMRISESDSTSVGKYGERVLTITNDFFNDQSDAVSKAKILLDDYSAFSAVQELEVKGTPALQLDDPIEIKLYGRIQNAKITKIQTSLSNGIFGQVLRVKSFNPRSYFRVGDSGSTIGGTDYIGF